MEIRLSVTHDSLAIIDEGDERAYATIDEHEDHIRLVYVYAGISIMLPTHMVRNMLDLLIAAPASVIDNIMVKEGGASSYTKKKLEIYSTVSGNFGIRFSDTGRRQIVIQNCKSVLAAVNFLM